jgi:hypothetical protein
MDLWIDIAFAVLLRTIKNERLARQLKSAFLKLYLAIGRAYASDPDFKDNSASIEKVGR